MPFEPTQPLQPMPPGEPDLRIFFHGLLLLRGSTDKDFCLVETHRDPDPQHPHVLSIETRTITQGQPDVVHMRHFGPLEAPDPGLAITLTPAVTQPIVYKFQPSSIFDPELGIGQADDFRWIINLQKLHGRPLDVDTTKTRPGIVIRGGAYYFYTAQRMQGTINLKQGGVFKKTLTAVASIIGANLQFDSTRRVEIKWREGAQERTLTLNKPQTGSSHQIYINNSPLYENPVPGGSHSELVQYYRVLRGVSHDEQFNLEYPMQLIDIDRLREIVDSQGGSTKFESRRGSPTIPCQSVVLEPGS